MNKINHSRRHFLKTGGALALGSTLPLSLVELAFAEPSQNFTFAYISDSHIQHINGNRFVRNWDRGLIRAVAETNLLTPKPDFVMFGGDLAQLGSQAELDHAGSRYFCESFYGHPCPTSGKNYATAHACGGPSRPASFVGYPARGIQ
ncbi:MAG: twin-arginine translocation signal domain-containing protein, partial [Methylococcaceae bacterium]